MGKNFICFSCLSIGDITSSQKIRCSKCGYIIDRKEYVDIYNYIKDALLFWHYYRRSYEEQYNKDHKISTFYCIVEPQSVAVFVLMAIASGVIGNASWALIKRFVKHLNQQPNPGEIETCFSEEEISNLVSDFNDYYNKNNTIPEEVLRAILHEMYTHEMADIGMSRLEKHIKKHGLVSSESGENCIDDNSTERVEAFNEEDAEIAFERVRKRIIAPDLRPLNIFGEKFNLNE